MLIALLAERDTALKQAHSKCDQLDRANGELRAKWREARRAVVKATSAAKPSSTASPCGGQEQLSPAARESPS